MVREKILTGLEKLMNMTITARNEDINDENFKNMSNLYKKHLQLPIDLLTFTDVPVSTFPHNTTL